MADITEIAVASWRLEKWLDNVNVERKMAAKSALRAIKRYLKENNIEIVDLTGAKFDVGLAVSVVNNESDETDEDKLIISEMVKPIIKENGAVIQYGQVILGDEVKKPKENNVVESDNIVETKAAEEEAIAIAASITESTEKEVIAEENVVEAKKTEETRFTSAGEEEKTKKKSWILISVLGLQLVLIALVIAAIFKIGSVTNVMDGKMAGLENSLAAYMDAQQEKSSETENIDLTSIQADIANINTEVDEIDSRLEAIETGVATLLENSNKETAEDGGNTEEQYITYIVQSGDTLIKICQKNGIDFYKNKVDILRINYMENADSLVVGQKLLLPKE